MQKAFLTNMKVVSSLNFYPENEPAKYCVFFVSSIFPDKKGVYFKASCRASGFSCEQVKRLKLHQNSLVNLTADITQFMKGEKIETTYEVESISIVNEIFEAPKEVNKEQNEREVEKFLHMLATDPFGRKDR